MSGWPGADALIARLPPIRGRLVANAPLAPITWFRVGGPAEVLCTPADEDDLADFLAGTPGDVPVMAIGIGSNLLVRDDGVPGVVIRLGRGFSDIEILDGDRVRVGTAVPDKKLAGFALRHGLAGFSFYHGIPGSIGGALRMNAGANGLETCEQLLEVHSVDRDGTRKLLQKADMGFTYRHAAAPESLIFTAAVFQGVPAPEAEIRKAMDAVQDHREASQPIRERTGGSTFTNPPGAHAWQLIDAAGCRGLKIGGAQVSEMHCNFLINTGDASGHDLELLGETVRARVLQTSGVVLDWEIKRVGVGPEAKTGD